MNIGHITKKIKKLPKYFWPITPWTALFAVLVLFVCAEASALVIQQVHNTAKQLPTTSSTKSQTPKKLLVTPTATPSQNSTPPTASSSSGSTTAKSPAPTTSTPTVTAPTVNMCDYDTYDKSALASEYLSIEDYLQAHINAASPTGNSPSDVSDLNFTITNANEQYAQSYNGYVSERQKYSCPLTVSAPIPIPTCAITGGEIVATCIANIGANEPSIPTF